MRPAHRIHRSLSWITSLSWLSVLACASLGQVPASPQHLGNLRATPQPVHSLPVQFTGEGLRPTAMVSGDFDEDGFDDLAIGYATDKGGMIALMRGNPEAVAPRTEASWLAIGRHEYIDPFLQGSNPMALQAEPSLMLSADVNGDGHLDLIYATKGSSLLTVKFGTGKGTFLTQTASFSVPGAISALASYRPGPLILGESLIVGYQSSHGAGLGILSYGPAGLSAKTAYSLPAVPTAFAVANLDADFIPDIAIVAGGQLMVLHGKNSLVGKGHFEILPFDGVESVAAGEFLFDRHAQLQLSVITASGELLILAHQGFDSRTYTPQEIAQSRRDLQRHLPGALSLAQKAGNTGNAPWIEVENHSDPALIHSSSNAPMLLRSRMSGSGGDDLVVLNSSQQQRMVISHSQVSSPEPVGGLQRAALPMQKHVEVTSLTPGNIVGALSMRVSADGRSGLVTLRDVDLSPEISVPATGNTFFVNVFTDNTGSSTDTINATRCTSGEPPSNPCTLRDAITYANQDASGNISAGKSDTIMLPVGTYSLTWQKGVLDANANGLTHLEILGPVSIIGEGQEGGVIVDAQNNDTAFTINPGPFGSFNPSGNSYVFDTTLTNLVIENAINNNNINAVNATTDTNNVGGALNWDAFGTGNLTLTNSTIQNCTVKWGAGGGIWAENSAGGGTGKLILTGSSILNNKTPEQGGGVYIAFPPVAMAATNTTISNNTAESSVNPSDPGGEGSGGGVFLTQRTGSPATPQTTLTGVTINSNATTVDGGGVYTNTGMILTTSLVMSNSAGRWGGGVFAEEATDSTNPQVEVQSTITSTNILSNLATTTGGGIAVGPDNPNGGNSLQISLSRIVGNTSGGTTGLGTVSPGTAMATNNWWGCNAGPGSAGCDSAGSGATFSPWAQFILTANPTTVNLGSNIALAVSLNTNSASASIPGAFPAVASDTYTYSLTGLTASALPITGTFSSAGTGSATLTPSSAGTGIISAKFDNQTSSVNLTVNATTTSLAISPSSVAYSYGVPSSITVQLTPSGAVGIIASDFTVTVDNSSSIGGSSFGLTLISNNNYQLTGPFNLISPGGHTLKVSFAGAGSFQASSTSVTMTVSKNTVTFGDAITPPKPIQGQGGTVQVTVTGMGTGALPSGTLSYAFDSGTSANVALSGGSANISIPAIITTGSHTLHITYGGDTNYSAATTTITVAILGKSETVIASISSTTATIDVFGLGPTPPSGQLTFNDVTAGSPVAAPVTLNTAAAIAALTPQVTTSTGANTLPDWTTVGDVNGDGKQDLITMLYSTDTVSVQLGNGDGTFQAATTTLISAGFGPAEAHLVSLRGNGTLDLIVGSFNQNQIAVLLGNGNGTFAAPAFYTVGTAGNTPTSLTTGDFNNDGKLDVAVANTSDNTVSILLGNGLGSLTPSGSAISVGRTPEAIRAGDFDDDGFSDLAVANYHDGTVTTLLNNKNGTFTSTVHSVGTGVGSGPQALAMHGAGTGLQLAVANFKDNTVSVFNSNGNGTFGAQTIVNVGKGPDDLTFADFNGDGIEDLVVANYTDGTVDLLLGTGGGSYTLSGPFKVGNNPYSAAVGDINLDGTPDILVANTFSNNTGVLLGGTEIAVQYSGLSLTAGHTLSATYNPDGASNFGSSTSPGVIAP